MKPDELIKLLKDAELKQVEVARLVNRDARQVARWVSGEAPVPEDVAVLLTILAFIQKIRNRGKKCQKKK